MKFDPITKNLYTDAGEFIKKLHCPLAQQWDQLGGGIGSPHRHCGECERSVLNTAEFRDKEMLALIQADPGTCLSVNATQANITIFRQGLSPRTVGLGGDE